MSIGEKNLGVNNQKKTCQIITLWKPNVFLNIFAAFENARPSMRKAWILLLCQRLKDRNEHT